MRVLLFCAAIIAGLPSHQVEFTFHHLHLNQRHAPTDLLAFYERLFNPNTLARDKIAGADAVRAGRTRLVIDRLPAVEAAPTALWHFGWGNVSLTETYLAHARQEVAWEPPLPADRLHLHLRSVIPAAAAAWYKDVLGAHVHVADAIPSHDTMLPAPEHRLPEAIVWFGEIALLLYRFDPPLTATRGQPVDHIAFSTADLDAAVAWVRSRGIALLSGPSITGSLKHVIIEGPDRMAIELLQGESQ